MATASAVGGGVGGAGELVQVVLRPLGGGEGGHSEAAAELGRRRHRQVLEKEFAAVADSWIATVSLSDEKTLHGFGRFPLHFYSFTP